MDDPFEVLGLPRRFDLPRSELEQRHRTLSRTLHPDRFVNAAPAEKRVALERAVAVNSAWRTLRDPLTRAAALLSLNEMTIGDKDRAPAALLIEIMELRESLEESRGDAEKVTRLREKVQSQLDAAYQVLTEVFSVDRPIHDALVRGRDAAVALRYLARFIEEADASRDADIEP